MLMPLLIRLRDVGVMKMMVMVRVRLMIEVIATLIAAELNLEEYLIVKIKLTLKL